MQTAHLPTVRARLTADRQLWCLLSSEDRCRAPQLGLQPFPSLFPVIRSHCGIFSTVVAMFKVSPNLASRLSVPISHTLVLPAQVNLATLCHSELRRER